MQCKFMCLSLIYLKKTLPLALTASVQNGRTSRTWTSRANAVVNFKNGGSCAAGNRFYCLRKAANRRIKGKEGHCFPVFLTQQPGAQRRFDFPYQPMEMGIFRKDSNRTIIGQLSALFLQLAEIGQGREPISDDPREAPPNNRLFLPRFTEFSKIESHHQAIPCATLRRLLFWRS